MLKKVAIGIGIVAALLLLAGVAAALLIDVNRYKPTLERMVTDATGRKLTIDGPLSLRMFPRLGVALPKSTLSGPGGNGAFASLSSASVAVAWLPLLTGRIVVDQVNVNGLQAALERRADGRSNIDDLLQRQKAAPKASSGTESSAISVSIRGISLNDANLSLRSADGSTIVAVEAECGTRRHRRHRLQAGSDFLIGEVEQAGVGCRPDADCRDADGCGQQPLRRTRSRGVGKGHFRPATDGNQAGRRARGLAAARRRRREAGVRLDLAGHATARAARHRRRDQREGAGLRSHDCRNLQARCRLAAHRGKADEPAASKSGRDDLRVPAPGRRRQLAASERTAEGDQALAQRQRLDRSQARASPR